MVILLPLLAMAAAAAAQPPLPSGAVYLQSAKTTGPDPDGWLSFSSLALSLYPKTSLSGRVPWLLV